MGTARWKGDAGYQGRPVLGEGRGLNVASQGTVQTGIGQGRMTVEAG